MVKIYIGIEDGVIGAVYCDQEAEVCIASLDADSYPKTLIREEKIKATDPELITAFIRQAKLEEKRIEETGI